MSRKIKVSLNALNITIELYSNLLKLFCSEKYFNFFKSKAKLTQKPLLFTFAIYSNYPKTFGFVEAKKGSYSFLCFFHSNEPS